MKTNELMIGDWVCITDDDTDAHFNARVEVIDALGNIYVKDPGDETSYPYSVDCVDPIPLTSEILEKNGFCRFWDEDVMLMTRDNVVLEVGNNYKTFEDGRVYFKGIKMYYVHQLQNVLRLCGIDKTIKL